mgnify:CR=1 FL=1
MQDSPFVLGFTAGELSPWLSTRFDLQAYQRGAAVLRNFLVQPYGGISRRCGTEFVGASFSPYSDETRLIPFSFSETDSLMLEISPGSMRLYRAGELVRNAEGEVYTKALPWDTAEEVMSLHFMQVNDHVYVTTPLREPYVLRRYADNNWAVDAFLPNPFPRESYLMQNQGLRGLLNEGNYTAVLTLEPGVMRFSQEMENKEYVLADVEIPSQTLFLKEPFSFNSQALPDLASSTVMATSYYSERDDASGMYYFYTVIRPYQPSYYKGSPSARDYPDCFMPGVMRLNDNGLPYEVCGDWEVRTTGEWNGVWELWRSYDTKSYNLNFKHWDWTCIRTMEQNSASERKNYIISGSEEVPCRMVLVCRSADSSSVGAHIYFNILGGSREYKFKIKKVLAENSAEVTVQSYYLDTLRSFHTRRWAFGAYGARNGYPTFSGLHQGRLWFGGFSALPTTLIASTANDFTNFSVTSADDSALHLTLATDNQSRICWICPSRVLLVGTSASEWTLSAPDGGGVTPSNASFARQSSVGSEAKAATGVENTVFYVQRGGKRLREISYKLAADGFTSTDTSLLAEHLFTSGVKEWLVQRGGSVRLWVLMNDNTLAVLSTNAEQQVTAWQRVTFQGREPLHLAALPASSGSVDEVWLVLRNSSSGMHSIERIASEALFVDGSVTCTPSADAVTISPGAHLADLHGFIYPQNQPEEALRISFAADGSCSLPEAFRGRPCTVGAAIQSELVTMPLESARTYNTVRQEGRARLRLLESEPTFSYKSGEAERWEVYEPERELFTYPHSGEIRVSQIPEPGVGQSFALRVDGVRAFNLLSLTIEFDFHGR